MILILGGTTEGRMAVKVADEAGSPYYYSTKGELQEIICRNGTHVTGGMDASAMAEVCRNYKIRLIVDGILLPQVFILPLHKHLQSCRYL